MSNVVAFPGRDPEPELDLATAVEIAIRDLRDLSHHCVGPARAQANDCRRMLEKAFKADCAED